MLGGRYDVFINNTSQLIDLVNAIATQGSGLTIMNLWSLCCLQQTGTCLIKIDSLISLIYTKNFILTISL